MFRLLWPPAALLAAALSTFFTAPSVEDPHQLHALLRDVAHFSASDVAAVHRNQPVARVLDTERTEIAVAGAVHIRAPRERILDRYRDVSLLARSEMVMQVGRFGSLPGVEDLRELVFENYDLESLRDCKLSDCAVRLPASAMKRIQEGVNWRAAGWRTEAAALWRQILTEYVIDYRANGDDALAVYHNRETPLRLQEQFTMLYRAAGFVTPFAPDLLQYLQEFPRAALPGAEDILYWSKDNFGLRPVVAVTHLSIHAPPPGASTRAALVGSKQIYAAHYFDAALGIALAVDDGAGGSYLIVLNRARTRSLVGWTRVFVRGIVQGRARDGVEKMLRSMKTALERAR